MNYSTTYVATIVSVLVFVLPLLGIEVIDEGTLAKTVSNIIGVISTLYIFYGRFKAGGISIFGLKK